MTEASTINYEATKKPCKVCFVTIGATASFDKLLKAVLDDPFLEALRRAEYTELLIQYGKEEGKAIYESFISREHDNVKRTCGINIAGFDFNTNGLGEQMRKAKGHPGNGSKEGLVISHAGSGTILDALRVGVPLVVVPNTELLHNHQVELAEELAKQEYVVHGSLNDLAASISEAEKLRERKRQWPPPNSGDESYKRGLAGVMDDEMGWVD
ncbi:hypothetical protein GJ744_009275 [Endocarpon pusillum]|uniref:UDP-N-acetylglucosamine transferase subunit ALG13 n=1 Tax=Endocarpon pusillum TaxID=364733 RepID=A0A8H7E3W3_9EURO|nr:hypothetical protein GJ744_009275 [Endocarpon pusillum]